MKIAVIASEAVPFVKVGGLADMVGALCSTLAAVGHQVTLILPLYAQVDRKRYGMTTKIESLGVPLASGSEWCRLLQDDTTQGFETLFIEHHGYFSRQGVYTDASSQGFVDNGERFVFFSRAALQACVDSGLAPAVIHCHDWMTAIVPAMCRLLPDLQPDFARCGTLLTVHNVGDGYQGKFPKRAYDFSGLDQKFFVSDQFEDFGWLNLLKAGIAQADLINAVSPRFAQEITQEPGGAGLQTYFQRRQNELYGILNGVDYSIWNPESDPFIPAHYSHLDLSGKAQCKAQLQETFGLQPDPRTPLFGVISRLSEQKGLDFVLGILPQMMQRKAQFVLLGTGDPFLERSFVEMAARYQGLCGVRIGYSDRVAHLIEAGSDFFFMPSRFEPCGLNQMYSLRYGTIPIVRAVGGLDDTVENFDPTAQAGTGFKFLPLDPIALRDTVVWAMEVYRRMPEAYRAMQIRAMQKRFSWTNAIRQYEQLYSKAIALHQSAGLG